jgi:hypothetical protein
MAELSGKRLVLGVTGGIAAYKAAELARLLGKAGAEVHAVLTASGAQFVTPVTFQALSGNPAWVRPVGCAHAQQHGAHRPLARRRRHRRRAGLGGFPRQAGARTGRRPAVDAVSGARLCR